ncbi:MAG: NAD-dependent epimerase/dehydratase family protein [Chitinophagaceae bacterium]|nr:NAD-dependent epimerase/dehydratase family protein [Chitinophagaceae bacterium]
MDNLKHVILGSNGIVGTEVHKALQRYSNDVKLVSRTNRAHPQTHVADLTDLRQTIDAVKGYDVVYLTAGVTYSAKLWAQYWPVILDNVIDATLDTGARLVFFDNVYMYGKVDGWMTEDTPFNPITKKGEVRARLAQKILDAIAYKGLTALIARSADFYGYSNQSIPHLLVFERISKNENPLVLLDAGKRHSFTYTKDIGTSIAYLAQEERNFNQTWHLPTDRHVLRAGDFVRLAAAAFGKDTSADVLTPQMLDAIAQSDELIGEYREMLYQNEMDYLFSSEKYEDAFKHPPTPYAAGVKELVSLYRK